MKSKFVKKMMAIVMATMIVGVSMVGCDSGEKKKELNIFNWTEYIPQSVLDGFEDEYGIKVNYSTFSSNDEMLAKVKSASKGTYDLAVPGDYMVTIMAKSGLLEELDKSKLENVNNLDPAVLDKDFDKGNKYSIPYLAGGIAVIVDTDVVKEEITSYEQLLNSDYENSIVALDEQRGIIGIALKANGYSMNDGSEESLAEAKKYLVKLKPNIKAFDSDSPKTALITGEASIGLVWNAEAALAMREKESLEVFYPQEGAYLNIDNFVIPKGAKNVEEAYLFIDYLLRPEVIAKISEEYPYTVVNKAAEEFLSDEYKNNKASSIPSEVLSNGEYIKDVGEDTAKFDKLWSEFKGE